MDFPQDAADPMLQETMDADADVDDLQFVPKVKVFKLSVVGAICGVVMVLLNLTNIIIYQYRPFVKTRGEGLWAGTLVLAASFISRNVAVCQKVKHIRMVMYFVVCSITTLSVMAYLMVAIAMAAQTFGYWEHCWPAIMIVVGLVEFCVISYSTWIGYCHVSCDYVNIMNGMNTVRNDNHSGQVVNCNRKEPVIIKMDNGSAAVPPLLLVTGGQVYQLIPSQSASAGIIPPAYDSSPIQGIPKESLSNPCA